MKIVLRPYKLELKDAFTLSYGTFHHRDSLIIEIIHKDISGYGEATAISYYGYNITAFIDLIKQFKTELEKIDPTEHPAKNYPVLQKILLNHPFLQSALDCALWNWYANYHKTSIRMLLGFSDQPPQSSFTLSGSPAIIKEKLHQMDWPIFKIKMGSNNDFEILEILDNYKGKAKLRIDVNGGWTLDQAKTFVPLCIAAGIKLIEQPLARGQESSMSILKESWPEITWVADESIQKASDIDAFQYYFDAVNLKLMKSGGITPTLEMIELAEQNKLQIALGCMTESSVGISALAELAPKAKFLDMDGSMLIKNDPAKGSYLKQGKIVFDSIRLK